MKNLLGIKNYDDENLERYALTNRKYIVCKFEAENFNILITEYNRKSL